MSSDVQTMNNASSVVTTTNSSNQGLGANKIVIKLSRVSPQIDANSLQLIQEDNHVLENHEDEEDDESFVDEDDEDLMDEDEDSNEMQIESNNYQSNGLLNGDNMEDSEVSKSSQDLIDVILN